MTIRAVLLALCFATVCRASLDNFDVPLGSTNEPEPDEFWDECSDDEDECDGEWIGLLDWECDDDPDGDYGNDEDYAMLKMIKDSYGNDWDIQLNLGSIDDIERVTGVCILSEEFGEMLNAKKVSKFELAWLICASQAFEKYVRASAQPAEQRRMFLSNFSDADSATRLFQATADAFNDFFQSGAPTKTDATPLKKEKKGYHVGGRVARSSESPRSRESKTSEGSPSGS